MAGPAQGDQLLAPGSAEMARFSGRVVRVAALQTLTRVTDRQPDTPEAVSHSYRSEVFP